MILSGKSPATVLPSFRPDRALDINNENYLDWLNKLRSCTDLAINNYQEFQKALIIRIEFFNSVGCKVSDHGMNYVPYAKTNEAEVSAIFVKVLAGNCVSFEDKTKFCSYTLIFLGNQYAKHGWVMQYHMNVTRNNNRQMFNLIGPDSGFDAINDSQIAYPLSCLLDEINCNGLPKTILYSLNPKDNYVLAALIAAFQTDEARETLLEMAKSADIIGKDGCLISSGKEQIKVPGFHVHRLIDPVGAGDSEGYPTKRQLLQFIERDKTIER